MEYSKLAFVFVDPHGAPGQRFKMVTTGMAGVRPLTGARVGTSADGLRWSVAAENSSNIRGDTQKVAFWDGRIGRATTRPTSATTASTTPSSAPAATASTGCAATAGPTSPAACRGSRTAASPHATP